MNEDYLWDRSGPPEPEIAELERVLAPLRYRHREPRPKSSRWTWVAAIAAGVGVAAIGLTQWALPRKVDTAWKVAGVNVRRGDVVKTAGQGVQLEAYAVGRINVAPNSEIRATGGNGLALKRGELHAFIWAPAREFVVETPSAKAIDLGCQYTLSVDDTGDGRLEVTMGWVAFDNNGRESFIPAGAQCRTHKKSGPGVPWFSDATMEFRDALARLERGDAAYLPLVLREARERDGLTLWHLLARTKGGDRAAVYDRFAALTALPKEVTREGVLRQEPRMMDLCWNALSLESTGWWRGWERRWGG